MLEGVRKGNWYPGTGNEITYGPVRGCALESLGPLATAPQKYSCEVLLISQSLVILKIVYLPIYTESV